MWCQVVAPMDAISLFTGVAGLELGVHRPGPYHDISFESWCLVCQSSLRDR